MEENEILSELYAEYASIVYRYALFALRHHDEAEDIVQEVFLRVCQGWQSFRGDAHVRTWILQIARNCIVDTTRRNRKSETLSHRNFMMQDAYETLTASLEIEEMFACMPKAERKLLNLRIVEDLSVADTAEVLQCSKGKVRVDTHRALVRLRKVLAEAAR